jgi:hypothetical protein
MGMIHVVDMPDECFVGRAEEFGFPVAPINNHLLGSGFNLDFFCSSC